MSEAVGKKAGGPQGREASFAMCLSVRKNVTPRLGLGTPSCVGQPWSSLWQPLDRDPSQLWDQVGLPAC